MQSSASWNALADRPRIGELRESVTRILQTYGDEVGFVVLFGSMARGDYGPQSDLDLLIGLRDDRPERFIDRLLRFGRLTVGPVDVLVYDRAELERMLGDHHPLLLEACADGVVLQDTGAFACLRDQVEAARRAGRIRRVKNGWDLVPAGPTGP
ncbi:MAG: nucleotidyltransferase domain-containing protein [Deltaproteobacteria bacterium]|nr:nucleotidyltransferase domain-containing protein [Deltaproteobacteria bacterium]